MRSQSSLRALSDRSPLRSVGLGVGWDGDGCDDLFGLLLLGGCTCYCVGLGGWGSVGVRRRGILYLYRCDTRGCSGIGKTPLARILAMTSSENNTRTMDPELTPGESSHQVSRPHLTSIFFVVKLPKWDIPSSSMTGMCRPPRSQLRRHFWTCCPKMRNRSRDICQQTWCSIRLGSCARTVSTRLRNQ